MSPVHWNIDFLKSHLVTVVCSSVTESNKLPKYWSKPAEFTVSATPLECGPKLCQWLQFVSLERQCLLHAMPLSNLEGLFLKLVGARSRLTHCWKIFVIPLPGQSTALFPSMRKWRRPVLKTGWWFPSQCANLRRTQTSKMPGWACCHPLTLL